MIADTTTAWLDQRYRKTNEQGVYRAHQPIYGFYDSNCEPNVLERYLRSYRILQAASHIQGRDLLDVGSSEGFQAYMAQRLLDLEVTCCDVSEEACNRAREIFKIHAQQADARDIPFEDSSFDIVTCSETLEHVDGYELAVKELLRVAKRAVIITVPHESRRRVAKNRKSGKVHAHINAFDKDSLHWLPGASICKVISQGHQNGYWHRLNPLIERLRLSNSFLAKPLAKLFIRLDPWLVSVRGYNGIIFTIIKDPDAYSTQELCQVRLSDILNFSTCYHYLK